MTPDALAAALAVQAPAVVSRAISLVEDEGPGSASLLATIRPRLGRAHRVGMTGPPGAGKSTLALELVRYWRSAGPTAAVVAVDPSSPRSGGALLGDRIRMEGVALDQGVFIRSMATRGALGGLARRTREVCDVLDAAGYDLIVVETVGVGQTELDVATATDTTVVVLVPESGDGIQTLKSGLLEVADVFVVNKADRPEAERLAGELAVTLRIRRGIAYGASPPQADPSSWEPPIVSTVATAGQGVEGLADALARHRDWLTRSGELDRRRRNRSTLPDPAR